MSVEERYFTKEIANKRQERRVSIGKNFALEIPINSKVVCWGDVSTKGITQPGRVYADPEDHNVIVRYTIFEGKKPENGLQGVLGLKSVRSDKK